LAKKDGVGPAGKALYVDGPSQAKRVQTFSTDTDQNEEKLLELGNNEVAEKTNDLSTSFSIEFNNYGSMATFMQALGQGQWQGENNVARVITDTAFDNAIIDTITHMSNDDATKDHAEWMGRGFLTSFNFTYPADGIATETYDFEGAHSRKFLNDWVNPTVYKADFLNSTTAIISGSTLQATHNPILVLVDEDVKAQLTTAGDTITLTDNGSDTDVTATNSDGNITFTSGDRVRVVVSGSGTTYTLLPSTPAGIGGLRRGFINAYLYNPAGNAEKTLRIQSLSIDADLSREELVELGSKKPYFRKLTRPINISIAVDINETDLEEYAKLVGSETGYDADTLREIDFDDFLKDNVLEIIEYKSDTAKTFANELRRIKMTSLSVASDSDSTSVSDVVGTGTINLTAENFLLSGTSVNPFL